MVVVKLAIVLFVIVVGAFYVNPANWHPFAPFGYTGISFFGHTLFGQTGAGWESRSACWPAPAIIFFAYIGFDSVSTHAEEAKNPQRDVPIGIIASLLICTVLYIAVSAVLTGMVPSNEINIDAPVVDAFRRAGLTWMQYLVAAGAMTGHHVGAAGDDAQPAARLAGDGARRPAAAEFFRCDPPEVPHALEVDDPDRRVRRGRWPASCR